MEGEQYSIWLELPFDQNGMCKMLNIIQNNSPLTDHKEILRAYKTAIDAYLAMDDLSDEVNKIINP